MKNLIDQDLFLADLKEYRETVDDDHRLAELYTIDQALNIALDQPVVDAEPVRHGRWLKDPHSQVGFPEFVYMMRKCSECGHSWGNVTPYCPWCGSKMDGKR